MEKKYNHKIIEKNKYDIWLENQIFSASNKKNTNKNKKYTIVIPPPNVTGKLHLGHAWDGYLQDVLIRNKKLEGYDVSFIPGMDHAGIATQAKVEERLRKDGISRFDLGRKNFVDKVWEWKNEYGQVIKEQWAKLGLSLDYKNEHFTLNDNFSEAVNKVFISLYNKGIIYKGKRVISWDPLQETALSNIEVNHQDVNGKMYYFKYNIVGSNDYLTVATTRPETMFGDQCLVVNPDDDRYQYLLNSKVINPANGKEIPIISDRYVDVNFGTGVMKCTPAHDFNDFEIGKRHNLEMPICMDKKGIMNNLAQQYQGQDRLDCRKNLVKDLKDKDLVVKIDEIVHQVGFSERSNAIVEPMLSDQWFVKMDVLANEVIKIQKNDDNVNFFPNRFDTKLLEWMENIQDWCISRQLWWGHQIPAFYNSKTGEIYVGENKPKSDDWVQDEDVLDTWFSSALWPLVTTDFDFTKNKITSKRFPVDVLVTGYDILFFWVSRMMFQSLEFADQKPFKDVLIHGLIRDKDNQKMSKSKGNGIDPMDVIEEFGSDALRWFLVTSSSPGQDLRFSDDKMKQSWNFINKIWNATRYIVETLDNETVNLENDIFKMKNDLSDLSKWILNKIQTLKNEIKALYTKYEFAILGAKLYKFVWDDFCSLYIELTKVNLQKCENKNLELSVLKFSLKELLKLMHPFMPFVTEELFLFVNKNKKDFLWNQTYNFEKTTISLNNNSIETIWKIISKIRDFRNKEEIKFTTPLTLTIKVKQASKLNKDLFSNYLKHLTNVDLVDITKDFNKQANSLELPFEEMILEFANIGSNIDAKNMEILKKQIKYLEQEINRSKNILNNENFMKKANEAKKAQELEKYNKYQEEHKIALKKLKSYE